MVNDSARIKLIIMIILLACMLWLLSINKGLGLINGHIYDFFVNIHLQTKPTENKNTGDVLIVKLDEQFKKNDNSWLALLDNILLHHPKLLIINHFPEHVSEKVYAKAAQHSNVFFLRYITNNPTQETEFEEELSSNKKLQALPISSQNIQIKTFTAKFPEADHGVYRRNTSTLPSLGKGQKAGMSFEYQVLEVINSGLINDSLVNSGPYLINYLSGNHYLPSIQSQRVVSNSLISDLIQDKIILVGNDVLESGYSMVTPIKSQYQFSLLDYQGYSLATVLEDNSIRELSNTQLIVLLLIQSLLSLYLYQWGNRHLSFFVTFSVMTTVILATWVLLNFYLIWLPIFEILFLQFLLYHVIFRFRSLMDEEILQKALLNVTSRTQERVIPASFYQLDDPWNQVITLVNQTLNLSRLIFLERVTGDHRLKEVKALNCSIDDIHEMRRDYHRTPYSSAIKEKGPILLKPHPYLVTTDVAEEQYLVPLVFSEEVLGFWAFGVQPEHVNNNPLFLSLVRNYANQISELLYFRQRFQQILKKSHSFLRYLGLHGEITSQRLLKETIELLNNRLDSQEAVFNGMKTATILYDLFGRVVQMNKNMEKFTHSRNLSAYDMTALDFINQTTGLELPNVRIIMQHLITEQKTFNLPLAMNEQNNRFYVLSIKPLQSQTTEDNSDLNNQEIAPFQVLGILLELNDMTEVKEDLSDKKKMNEHFFFQIRNDLEPLLMGVSMLKDTTLPQQEKESIISLMSEKLAKTSEMIKTLHNYFYQDNSLLTTDKFPVEPKNLLQQVIHSDAFKQREDNITIDMDMSTLESLVYAEPKTLKALFFTIIEMLMNDAVENSSVFIQLDEKKKFLEIDLFNKGFGMPDEQFQASLFNKNESTSQEMVQFQRLLPLVKTWQGEMKAGSSIGTGIYFKLKLCKVFT